MEKYRFWLREHLSRYRESVDKYSPRRFMWILFITLVLGLTLIISTAYMPWLYGFEQGSRASRTVVASETVTVSDAQATQDLKSLVASAVEPVYTADPQALPTTQAQLNKVLAAIGQARASYSQGGSLDAAAASVKNSAPSTLSDTSLRYMITAGSDLFSTITTQAQGALQTVYSQPITAASIGDAKQRLRTITDKLAISMQTADAVYELDLGFIGPNEVVNHDQTLARQQAAMDSVAPVLITITKGQEVVKKGEVVTSREALELQALGITETRTGWQVWLGIFFICLLEGAVFFRMLGRFNKSTGLANIMVLTLVVLILGFTVVARLLVLDPLSPYLVPVAGLGMIVAIILNARSSFLSVTILSLNLALITNMQMRYALVGIIVGSLAVYLVSRVVQRAALLGAGALVMVIAFFTIFSVEFFRESGAGSALSQSLWGLAHGAMAWVLTVLLLLLLDLVFSVNTPLRLLELANPAQPLLRKLLQVAPGTYNHSISMGNLAEAAAEAIGADPLLARVGAYYHDIGKTVRPEYFIENQIYVDNPHDRLSPNLSKLAIAAHVRDGEHLAKLHGLPGPVVDIIRQHHGTTIMAFFYHKAQETSRVPVDESTYRYEEEKPHSKEAAIVMLADGVEAAVRAMQNPTRRKIQGLIQEVVRQRMQDGQLDESELTLSDLHKIRDSFDTSLRGLVGHRISYPERNEPKRPAPGAKERPTRSDRPMSNGTVANGSATNGLRVPPSALVSGPEKDDKPTGGE